MKRTATENANVEELKADVRWWEIMLEGMDPSDPARAYVEWQIRTTKEELLSAAEGAIQ